MEERAVDTIQKHWRLSRARTAGKELSHRLPCACDFCLLLQLPEALRADTSIALHGETTCLRETLYCECCNAGIDSPL